MKNDYQLIREKDLKRFLISRNNDKFLIQLKKCPNNILLSLPFVLDEDVVTLAGMMPDGSLIKDIRRIYFGQKKDYWKIIQFGALLKNLFSPNNRIFIREGKGVFETYTNSTVLCHFLYYILGFTKSDEEMRIPKWIFYSPDSVKRAYLSEAFAMEGCIFKSLYEIRFITKDHNFAKDIQNLLLKLGITSFVKERIGRMHRTIQYRISIYRKENFEKFKEIGFTMPLHKERFKLICKKYKI